MLRKVSGVCHGYRDVIHDRRYCDNNIWEIIWKSPLFSSGLFCSWFVKMIPSVLTLLPKTAQATPCERSSYIDFDVYEKVREKFQVFLMVVLILYRCSDTNICQIILQASLFSSGLFFSCFVTT